ncbi:hypothetical protein NA78x_003979 [Anatilimnocola sp. NA78]|uniref:hypothetical protein n=1 Tax=Anatilimnocola sp. NA78 TaxID=3415683 RepID=UPI003CE5BB54
MSKFMERFGINLRAVHCPECGRKLRFLRMPTSLRQMCWGGYTCRDCNCEIDRWGQPLETASTANKTTA